MPHPLDEYPIHQAPYSFRHVPTSDRNFYDRSYFNCCDRSGTTMLVAGLGVYPNLGVMDAFATVRRGDRQFGHRASDALADDRLHPAVGPFRLEVLEPLQRIRLVCDRADSPVGFDLTWEGAHPAVDEEPHVMRAGARAILDARRFAQTGNWTGTLVVDGEELAVTPAEWFGTRDRSWGIRPVGEAEPAGRNADEPLEGFWWLYVPLQFEDFTTVVILQEQPDGFRILNDAVRVWADGRVDQLGWPRPEIRYRSGSRHPEGATLHLTERDGSPFTIEVEPLTFVALNVGSGYGGDPDWSHGQWRGREWSESATYDLTDPAIAGRIPFGVVDHAARARCVGGLGDGAEGVGLFEHGTFGRHDPSGFDGWGSVAP